MNGTILGMTKREINDKLDEIVDFSGVEKYLDTPVKFYSSGMRVRLGFAVAAHLEPEILIIDEVLSVGDAEFQKKCLGKMEDVSKNGRTVLFVSHNMNAVQTLCNKGIVLKNGCMRSNGSIEEAVSSYLAEYSNQQLSLVANGQPEFENELVRLLSAQLLNLEALSTEDDIRLQFRFEYKRDDEPVLDVTYHLYDELNTLVFVGSSAYTLQERPAKKILTFESIIPKQLLHEGNYRIARFFIVRDRGYVLLELNDVLAFDILPAPINSLGWMGKKQGVVKPNLKWTVSHD